MTLKAIFTILGCGTSTGVPLPGCSCNICSSNDSRDKRNRCSAWIRVSDGTSIIIDTGPDFRRQALDFNIKKVDAVVYTHAHADHILGLDDLRAFNFIQRKPVPGYATKLTWQAINKIFHYILEPDNNYRGGLVTKTQVNYIEPGQAFKIGCVEIMPFALVHGNMEVLGFRIGNLAYATDCNFIPIASKKMLDNLDYLILDGLRYEEHATHFTIPQAIVAAQELGAKKTYLTHLTHTISYAQENPKLPSGVELCFDGLEIEFDLK